MSDACRKEWGACPVQYGRVGKAPHRCVRPADHATCFCACGAAGTSPIAELEAECERHAIDAGRLCAENQRLREMLAWIASQAEASGWARPECADGFAYWSLNVSIGPAPTFLDALAERVR